MIEIIDFKAMDKPIMKAIVSIKIPKWGGFIIRNIGVFEKDKQRWISFPSKEFEQEGKKKYHAYNLFEDPKIADAFRDKFFEAYDFYVKSKGTEIPNNELPF
jgi:DNA-binding cell septation regulator SpoVG